MTSKILTVRLHPNTPIGNIPIRKISYSDSSLEINEVEYADILKSIPEYWHTEKDKLTLFVFFDDNGYFCEREKQVFDYKTRQSDLKIYRFDHALNEEAKKLYNFFVQKFAEFKIKRVDDLYVEILNKINNMSYMKYSLLDYRNNLLKESDFKMLSDFPISEEEREQWTVYRQELRDMTKQETWVSNNIADIKVPVSPLPMNQLEILRDSMQGMESIPNNLLDELVAAEVSSVSINEIIKNITQTTIKFEILKSISNMKIPIFADKMDEILTIEQNYFDEAKLIEEFACDESIMPKTWWEAATSNIDKKIEDINNTLRKYDIDFTIGDIIDSITAKIKEENDVNDLLDDIVNENNSNGENPPL